MFYLGVCLPQSYFCSDLSSPRTLERKRQCQTTWCCCEPNWDTWGWSGRWRLRWYPPGSCGPELKRQDLSEAWRVLCPMISVYSAQDWVVSIGRDCQKCFWNSKMLRFRTVCHFNLTYLSILDMIFLERFKCLRSGSSERNCFIFDWPDHYSQYLCLPEKQCLARWLMFLSEMVRCRTCFSLRPTSRLTVCWVRTEPWLGSSSGLQRRRSTSNIFSPGWSEKLEHTWQQYHSLWKHGNINTSLGVNVTQMMN